MSVIDASRAVKAAGLSRATTYAGVEFEYTGAIGGVSVATLSYGRGGDQLFRVPLWDVHAQRSSTGGYPWSIDGNSSTTVFIKNTSAQQQKYYLQLNHSRGLYSVGVKTIGGGQTVTYDLRAMRDAQMADANGEVIPLDASGGQLHWSKVGGVEGVLIGRSEQADLASAVSSNYACLNCCDDNPGDADVTPSSAEGEAGGTQMFTATQRLRDCYGGVSGPIEVFDARWSSSDDSVATAAAGMVTAQAPGTVTIKAEWTETGYGYIPETFNFGGHAGLGGGGSCQPFEKTLRASASYQVRPAVRVTSADIAEDQISINLEPASATGQLRVFLDGPGGSVELVNRSQQGGETTAPFNTANLPNQEFTSIRATWAVNTLVGSGSLNYHMVVLGDYRQTCYNLPLESEFTGGCG